MTNKLSPAGWLRGLNCVLSGVTMTDAPKDPEDYHPEDDAPFSVIETPDQRIDRVAAELEQAISCLRILNREIMGLSFRRGCGVIHRGFCPYEAQLPAELSLAGTVFR